MVIGHRQMTAASRRFCIVMGRPGVRREARGGRAARVVVALAVQPRRAERLHRTA
jgi:hypothetical protein